MASTSTQVAVSRALASLQSLLQPKLEHSLAKGYHGVVGVTVHIQDGIVTHVKISSEQVAKPG